MTTPSTAAGRALLLKFPTMSGEAWDELMISLAAIEAEAREQERERWEPVLRGVLETRYTLTVGSHDVECDAVNIPDAACSCGVTDAVEAALRILSEQPQGGEG